MSFIPDPSKQAQRVIFSRKSKRSTQPLLVFNSYNNASQGFPQKHLGSNECLALTGAIKGLSKEKIYQGLGLESLRNRHWCRKLCLF